jgi:uncharacterized membrane protein
MILLSGALSLFFFWGQSLRLDEAQSLWQTSRAPLDIIRIVAGDVHVPLYHLLLHFWRLIFGDTVAIARSMSFLFLALLIPSTYLLGRRVANTNVGLFAAFLISISPFMNWYGNEIRMYTLFTLLAVLNQYFFLGIIERKPGSSWWHFISAALGIFSHYFFFLNLAAQTLFFFINRRAFPRHSFARFFGAALLLALLFSPWLYLVYHVGSVGDQQPVLEQPIAVNVFSTFSQFLFGFQDDHVNTVFLSLWPIGLIFAFISVRASRKLSLPTMLLLFTIVVSVASAFLVSVFLKSVFVSRYLSFTIPSLYILLAQHLDGYAPAFRRIAKGALTLLMLATLGIEIWSSATPVKENYREATNYLNQQVAPQDVIVLSAPFTVYPVEYYYRGPAPILTLPLWNREAFGAIPPFSEKNLPNDVAQITQNHRNVWVLLSYDQGYEPNIKNYFDTHYQQLQKKSFSSDLTLYEYKISYTPPFAVR